MGKMLVIQNDGGSLTPVQDIRVWRERGIVPPQILNLGTRLTRMFSFRPRHTLTRMGGSPQTVWLSYRREKLIFQN